MRAGQWVWKSDGSDDTGSHAASLMPGEPRAWTREYFENFALYRRRGAIRYAEQPLWRREAAECCVSTDHW